MHTKKHTCTQTHTLIPLIDKSNNWWAQWFSQFNNKSTQSARWGALGVSEGNKWLTCGTLSACRTEELCSMGLKLRDDVFVNGQVSASSNSYQIQRPSRSHQGCWRTYGFFVHKTLKWWDLFISRVTYEKKQPVLQYGFDTLYFWQLCDPSERVFFFAHSLVLGTCNVIALVHSPINPISSSSRRLISVVNLWYTHTTQCTAPDGIQKTLNI